MSKEEGSAVAGSFWSSAPVVLITSKWNDKINGQIAVTVITSSVVHFIPRLIVGIWKGNYTHNFIYNSKTLCIHLLKNNQMELVKKFGFYTGREVDKFENINFATGITGSPVLYDCHSYVECKIVNAMDGGDMTVFLVNVENGGIKSYENWMTLDNFYVNAPVEWINEYNSKLSRTVESSIKTINNINYQVWKP